MIDKVEGIVIREKEYKETDRLVWLFTREKGKISFVAKGAKRSNSRLSACTQLFTYGMYIYRPSKGLATLSSGEIIKNFSTVKRNLLKTSYVAYASELLDRSLEENQRQPYLFELYLQVLTNIDEGMDPEILIRIFETKVTEVLGIQPQLFSCTHCGRHDELVALSSIEGGTVCKHCVTKVRNARIVPPAIIRLLQIFLTMDLTRIGEIRVKKETRVLLKKFLNQYYDTHTGIFLKSRKFLEDLDFLEENE